MAGTQYALLTSLMAFGRTDHVGRRRLARERRPDWTVFWIATTLLAIPGLLLLFWLWRMRGKRNPSFREEGGAVNRRRGVIRAGGTDPFRSGAWGCRPGTGSSGLDPGRYKTVTPVWIKAISPAWRRGA